MPLVVGAALGPVGGGFEEGGGERASRAGGFEEGPRGGERVRMVALTFGVGERERERRRSSF